MADLKRLVDPKVIGTLSLTATRGVTAGWTAGIVQVVVAYAYRWLRERW